MKRIFKYQVTGHSRDGVLLPAGAQILSAIVQHDEIMVYALVDDVESNIEVLIRFVILGTGWHGGYMEGLTFLNTVVNGSLVWHVFYQKE